MGQQVARQLLNGELIEGQVSIQGVNDPLTISPGNGAEEVLQIPVAIRVVCQVEPPARPVFAKMARLQQAVHDTFISVDPWIIDKRFNLARARRKPNEIQRQSSQQGLAIGLGRLLEAFSREASTNEAVDRVTRPFDDWRNNRPRWYIGPVFLVFRAL